MYHPPPRHSRPCVTNGREGGVLVRRDELCDACRRFSIWSAGRSNNRTRREESGARRERNDGPSPQMAAGGSPHHRHSSAAQGRSVPRPGPAESMYPAPTGPLGGNHCPLSEAFERAVRIGGDVGAPVNWSRGVSRGLGEGEDEGEGVGRSRTRGEYGPFKPDAGNRSGGLPGGGLPSWPGGCGRHARRTTGRRTAGIKKQVRFAPKVEVLYFRRDWATNTLRSLSREAKARR